jgi:pimeloyl-ACP methyl ester carboxylesterase
MYEVKSDLVCQGLSPEEVKKKWETRKKLYDIYFNLTSKVKLGYLSRIIDHDPAPIIPKIKAPMLAIFAESDQFVNTAVDAPLTEQLLKQGGNDKYRIEIIPEANHWFMEVGRCLPPHTMEMKHEFNPKVLEIVSGFKEWYTDIRRG